MPAEEKSANPPAAPELSPLMKIVQPLLGERILSHVNFRGDDRIHVAREKLLEVCMLLRDAPELAFDFLADVTAVDYLGQPDDFKMNLEVWDENRAVMKRIPQYRHRIVPPPHGPEPRFAVVYHLMSTRNAHRLRIKCRVPEDDPAIPSVVPVWIGADWLERETYDMYGIIFTGHPNLQRIYLYEEFKGHPLRKDYGKWDEQPIQPFLGPGANEPRRAVVRPDNGDSRPQINPKPDEPRR